jgi:hypothetical protein
MGNKSYHKLEFGDSYYSVSENIYLNPNGEIFMLNKLEYSIDRISKDGELIEKIGRAGRGPGEFERMISFTVSQDFQSIFIIDNTQIEIYEYNSKENNYDYIDTLNDLFIEAYDICYLEGNLYLSGFNFNRDYYEELREMESRSKRIEGLKKVVSTGPIIAIDLEKKEVVNDFGYKYKSVFGFGVYDGILSQVELACNGKTKSIIAKMIYAPLIFSYSKEGEEKWAVKIKGLRNRESLEMINPISGVSWANSGNEPGESFDRTMPFREVYDSEYLILQFEEVFRIDRSKINSNKPSKQFVFKTSLLNTETGGLIFLGADQEYFLASANGRSLFSINNDSLHQHEYYLSDHEK